MIRLSFVIIKVCISIITLSEMLFPEYCSVRIKLFLVFVL